jgi:type I restriction enzyme S subunit
VTDWQSKPIGTVVKRIATGSTPPTSRPEYFVGQIPWFTPGDIGSTRNLVKSSRHISVEALSDGRAKLFEEQTLLVTCIGNIGRVGVLQVPASCNQQITALRFTDDVDVNYAYYWFVAYQHKLEGQATQAVVPILNNERLRQIDFFYPPLPKQQRIAAILGRADRLRRLRRTACELSDTYLESTFVHLFGDPGINRKEWDVASVEEILSKDRRGTQTGPFGSSLKRHEYVEEGIPVWGIDNVRENEFVERGSLFITPAKYRELSRYTVEDSDILVSRAGTIGRMCVAHPTQHPSIIGTNLVRVVVDTSAVLPEYFTALFTYFLDRIGNVSSGGTAYSFINPRMLKSLEIPIPPIALQRQFAHIVHKFERLRAQQREAECQAEHLFQALLHRAFRGEV